ncbi:MAG: GtrA family protein [Vicinamibacterales bacterium]
MNTGARLVRFSAVSALGVGVQLATIWFLTAVTHVHYLLAAMAAVGLTVVHNFAWHWRWTWRDRTESGGIASSFVRFALANGALSLAGNLAIVAVLVQGMHAAPVAANAVAIGACGLVNYWIGNTLVFRREASNMSSRLGRSRWFEFLGHGGAMRDGV